MRGKTKNLAVTALFAALMAVVSPWCIPIGAVPVSLATFMLYLAGGMLGWKRGMIAAAVYLLLGAVGLPVFAGFAGGMQHLLGVTGGFLWGYLPCAFCVGIFSHRSRSVLFLAAGMIVGTVLLYVGGTTYFCILTKTDFAAAFAICVLPFLPGDALKIVGAAFLCDRLRKTAIYSE